MTLGSETEAHEDRIPRCLRGGVVKIMLDHLIVSIFQ